MSENYFSINSFIVRIGFSPPQKGYLPPYYPLSPLKPPSYPGFSLGFCLMGGVLLKEIDPVNTLLDVAVKEKKGFSLISSIKMIENTLRHY